MDRDVFRTVIKNIKINDVIDVTFVDSLSGLNGQYKYLSSKVGKGKGGSLLVSLQNVADGTVLNNVTVGTKVYQFGTPAAEHVLTIVANGATYHTEVQKRDKDVASTLLTNLQSFPAGTRIELESENGEFNGVWTVSEVRKRKGRIPQVSVTLTDVNDANRKKELWSYRDSGSITHFAVV